MFQHILSRLDITLALRQASQPNDLIPVRSDDRVGGELANRFIEYLTKQIEDGSYAPNPASFVPVPKPGFTSRPAAVLTLVDRIVYEALVEPLRPRLAKFLLEYEIVLWPREQYVTKRWREFESLPVQNEYPYVVEADVSGFYDSIDHNLLEDDIVRATGERDIAQALREFLYRVMSSKRGLPQGLMPSDTLATTFLQPFDAILVRAGFGYWRHGDDVRIGAETISRAREAIAVSEIALRGRGLLINASKCAIFSRETYAEGLASGDAAVEVARKALLKARIDKLKSSDKELEAAIEAAKLDEQVGWDLFYHGTLTIDEVVPQLENYLQPSDIEVAERLFITTLEKAPGTPDALSKELFHQQLVRSLLRLTAARSIVAIPYSSSVLTKFPDKTEIVCTYLLALVKTAPEPTVAAVEDVVLSTVFTTSWQQAWLYRVLAEGVIYLSSQAIDLLKKVMEDEASHWLARTEAAKVLGRAQRLNSAIMTRLWSLAPEVYRNEIIAAVASQNDEWGTRFLKYLAS